MAAPLLCLVLFLAMIHHSSGAYCICKSGLSDTVLQRNIEYACGSGADCSPILQNGACYNPNTIRDHCNYAVNSYYQSSSQAPGTCNFSGTASISQTIPSQAPGCVYPRQDKLQSHYCYVRRRKPALPWKRMGLVTISIFLYYFVTTWRFEEIGGEKILRFPRVAAPNGLHIRVSKCK